MYVHRFAVIWKRCRKKFNFRKNYKYAEFSFLLLFWFSHDGLDIDRYVNMQGICLRTEKSLMTLPAPGQGI